MVTFGSKLRFLRENAELTQEALAKKAGIARVTLTRMETDAIKDPGWQMIQRLAAALGVSCEVFVDKPPPAKSKKARQ